VDTLTPSLPDLVSSKFFAWTTRLKFPICKKLTALSSDDGSGTIGVLNTALALTNFRIKNAVRFAFWGAEEFGKLGSYYYVKQINGSDAELAKMRAYLNFDMVSLPKKGLIAHAKLAMI
jgi:hypothetical protein